MSVVNRMLQDIDRRGTAAGIDTPGGYPDIRTVAARPGRSARTGRRAWIAALLFGACVMVAISWREWHAGALPNAAPQTIVAAQSPAAVAGASVPATKAPADVAETAAHQSALVAGPIEKPAASSPLAQRNAGLHLTDALKLSMQLSTLVADAPATRSSVMSAPAVSASTPGTTTIANVPVRHVATDETVLAARVLWSEGSRTSALATLREALAAAETARNNRATVPLARELAGLEVADNRALVALDLLQRLEPLFSDDAGAWALRGNAEQRLAMHAEAAKSYLAALRMKPTEGKWMLGAAISLAATGKLDEAQVWVERARERDAVTPMIGAYLQQLGIVVRR